MSDKINNRTHHTRFFEKLYGNLEKSSSDDKKDDIEIYNNYPVNPCEVDRRKILNSPSESSASSSEIFSINDSSLARCVLKYLKSFVYKTAFYLGIQPSQQTTSSDLIAFQHQCCHRRLVR